jgi:penicillin-binding protein 2
MRKFKQKRRLTIKNNAREAMLFNRRLWVSIFIILILSIILIARLFYLQVSEHKYYTTLSAKNDITLVPIPPKRGLIYDRNGVLLAKNVPVFSLMVTPSEVPKMKTSLQKIQKIIPLTLTDLQVFHRELKQHRRFDQIPLKVKLTKEQVAEFAVDRYEFPGFAVKAELLRQYPLSAAFAHTIGYVGRMNEEELESVDPSNYADTIDIGKTGIENYYEKELHGTVGYKRVETDSSGRVIRTLSITPPVSGDNLYLTIDSGLQLAAEKALGKLRGAIVAIQPSTGQILAMVSQPSFDPNQFVKGINEKQYKALTHNKDNPLYNRTIRGLYPMASTIKPIIGLAGLDSGTVTPNYQIFDPGWFRIPHTKHIFHNYIRTGSGWVNIHKAIVLSCDTYFYNLAYKLHIKPIDKMLNAFGLGKPTGVDLPNELAGTVPSPKYKMEATGQHWYTGDTVNTAIGQGYSQVTPLQLANITAILANRGKRYQPYLLDALQLQNQTKIATIPKEKTPVILKNAKNWKIIIKAMEDVIPDGTGLSFGSSKYTVASKTGTGQVRNDNGLVIKSSELPLNERPNSSFIVFAPVNHPQIALAVIVEHHPDTSPRIAKKVMDYYFSHEIKKKRRASASVKQKMPPDSKNTRET